MNFWIKHCSICLGSFFGCPNWYTGSKGTLNTTLHDHLRDVPCKDIFKFSASAAANEFCEWIQVGVDI